MSASPVSNAEALAKLDTMIERVRSLPKRTIEGAADDVAAFIKRELSASIAAGTTPTGEAWQPRKADGGKPLANALHALQVTVVEGSIVFVHLDGPEARHHRGWVRGGVQRQIIPTELPPQWVGKIRDILAQRFAAEANGGGDGR